MTLSTSTRFYFAELNQKQGREHLGRGRSCRVVFSQQRNRRANLTGGAISALQ
jgi:hypothetical protein